jgi:hypothetical protein
MIALLLSCVTSPTPVVELVDVPCDPVPVVIEPGDTGLEIPLPRPPDKGAVVFDGVELTWWSSGACSVHRDGEPPVVVGSTLAECRALLGSRMPGATASEVARWIDLIGGL